MTTQDRSAEARLARLEDLEAIERLILDYQRHIDARDFRAQSLLFAADGEWVGASGSARGPAAVEAMFAAKLAPPPGGGAPTRGFHLIASPLIDLDGDRATAEVACAYIVAGADGAPALHTYGHYRDVLVREQGSWRFLRRESHYDIPFHELAPPA